MIIKTIYRFIFKSRWKYPYIIIIGVVFGMSIYSFYISRAHSYLSDEPETCVNCHIMAPQYATWNHSSHRERANCNDCHVPHNNVVNKYFFKAKDGLRHATVFTMRAEPQVIFIKQEGQEVVQNNCIRCHSKVLLDHNIMSQDINHNRLDRKCWECHREVPHGRVNSLSSVPNARVPVPESPVPNWLRELMKKEKK
jgi:cytochrome c nitrite reductase small subunit